MTPDSVGDLDQGTRVVKGQLLTLIQLHRSYLLLHPTRHLSHFTHIAVEYPVGATHGVMRLNGTVKHARTANIGPVRHTDGAKQTRHVITRVPVW